MSSATASDGDTPALAVRCWVCAQPPSAADPWWRYEYSWVPTASITDVRAEPAGELLDLRDALVAAFGDDVGGAEFEGELLAVLVAGTWR